MKELMTFAPSEQQKGILIEKWTRNIEKWTRNINRQGTKYP